MLKKDSLMSDLPLEEAIDIVSELVLLDKINQHGLPSVLRTNYLAQIKQARLDLDANKINSEIDLMIENIEETLREFPKKPFEDMRDDLKNIFEGLDEDIGSIDGAGATNDKKQIFEECIEHKDFEKLYHSLQFSNKENEFENKFGAEFVTKLKDAANEFFYEETVAINSLIEDKVDEITLSGDIIDINEISKTFKLSLQGKVNEVVDQLAEQNKINPTSSASIEEIMDNVAAQRHDNNNLLINEMLVQINAFAEQNTTLKQNSGNVNIDEKLDKLAIEYDTKVADKRNLEKDVEAIKSERNNSVILHQSVTTELESEDDLNKNENAQKSQENSQASNRSMSFFKMLLELIKKLLHIKNTDKEIETQLDDVKNPDKKTYGFSSWVRRSSKEKSSDKKGMSLS